VEHLVTIALLMSAVLVTAVARRIGWSAPLVVTLTAAALSFIPGMPHLEIDPTVILTLVLPPLLYSSALNVSVISFRQNLRGITMLGVVLVLVTAAAVAWVAYTLIPDMTWAGAFVLGAIVAPPDAVSAAAVGRKLNLPRRLMTVLLGESLINDAASLTVFRVALTVAGGLTLSLGTDAAVFAFVAAVGVAVGVFFGWSFNLGRRWLRDPVVESIISFLIPFLAYISAEEIHGVGTFQGFSGSGVLAVVIAGLMIGHQQPRAGYRARLQEQPLWASIDTLLESTVFGLIGLQLSTIVTSVLSNTRDTGTLVLTMVAVLTMVVLIRPAFIFASAGLAWVLALLRPGPGESDEPTLFTRSIRVITPAGSRLRAAAVRAKDRIRLFSNDSRSSLNFRELLVLSWSGMRGVVTIAAAISVPALLPGDAPFPAHDTILLIAFTVTVTTLLLQGLTLPLLIRSLNLDDRDQQRRDALAKRRLQRSTLRRATDFVKSKEGNWRKRYGDETVDRAVELISRRLGAFDRQLHETEAAEQDETTLLRRRQITDLRRQVLTARRDILIEERDKGNIDEELMRELLHSIDAEEFSLDAQEHVRSLQ
jgi:CPA1 family monovalent cation:H+ antiporter